MSPFAALKRLFTSDVSGSAPMDDAFVQVDTDALATDMRLRERAEERGSINLPPPDDTTLDVIETEIVSRIKSELNRAQIDARNQTQSYENRLAGLQLLHEVGTIKAAALKAIGDFQTLVIDWRNQLSNRRDAIRESYYDLKNFKVENGLSRPAVEAAATVVTAGSIAITFLIEVFGNALFLKVNDELGYLGGTLAALMVAGINIGVGLIMGRFLWPRTKLKRSGERGLAWAGIWVWIAFLFVWNLFAAHFRDAKSSGLADPQSAAITSLVGSPFGLEGLYSWGLLIIGICAGGFAARTAFRMDDPYPGYGERDRQHRQRCDEYAEEVGEANRQMTGVRDEAIDDANEVKRQLGIQFRERDRIQGAYNRFVIRYKEHQEQLEQVANGLLSTYRDLNRQRRTEPCPAHFGRKFELLKGEIEPLHDQPIRDSEIQAAEAALNECIEDVASEFKNSIEAFEPLDKLKAELERGTL